jgi:hypothetical protein
MPQQRDIFDPAVVEEFPKVLCCAGKSVAVIRSLRVTMRTEIEREAVKFAREPFKLCLETGGRLRPARQDNQSSSRAGF